MNLTNSTDNESADDVPGWSVPVGIFLGLSASIGINVGNNMQAMALAQQQEKGLPKKTRVFWIGTTIFAVASIVNFGAFGFAPAAVLAPLESIQFVSNLLFARFVNKETVSWRMCLGSALVITGTIFAIVVGPSGVAKLSIADLKALWVEPAWIGYLAGIAAAFTLCMVVHVHYQRRLDEGKRLRGYRVVLPFTFALSSAFIGSQAVVYAKTMSELVELVFTIGPLGLLRSWFFYFSCVLLFASMGGWLYRLNAALGKYDPLFIIPLLQSNYILFSTVTGGIYFQEFLQLDALGSGMFGLGVAIMFLGLYLLAPVSVLDEDAAEEGSVRLADTEVPPTTEAGDGAASAASKPAAAAAEEDGGGLAALRVETDDRVLPIADMRSQWPLTPTRRVRAATLNMVADSSSAPLPDAAAKPIEPRERANTYTTDVAVAIAQRRTRTRSTATPHTPAPAWPVTSGIEIVRLSISALPKLSIDTSPRISYPSAAEAHPTSVVSQVPSVASQPPRASVTAGPPSRMELLPESQRRTTNSGDSTELQASNSLSIGRDKKRCSAVI